MFNKYLLVSTLVCGLMSVSMGQGILARMDQNIEGIDYYAGQAQGKIQEAQTLYAEGDTADLQTGYDNYMQQQQQDELYQQKYPNLY